MTFTLSRCLSVHPARREIAIATDRYDERWPSRTSKRPKAIHEPDRLPFHNVMEVDQACDRWLAGRGLSLSWRVLKARVEALKEVEE